MVVKFLIMVVLIPLSLAATLDSIELKSTYEAISVRVPYTGTLTEDEVTLEYKKTTDSVWITGHPLALIPNNRLIGSIFYLEEGEEYDVRVSISGDEVTRTVATLESIFPTGIGSDIYVGTTGSDSNPGTQALPYATIQHAADNSGPGDVIHIMPGVYYETTTITNSGNSNAYIVFQAEGDVKIYGSKESLRTVDSVDDWVPDSGAYKHNLGSRTYHASFGYQRLFNYNQEGYTFNQFTSQAFASEGIIGGYWSDNSDTWVILPDGSDPDTKEMNIAVLNRAFTINANYIILDGLEIGFLGTDGYGRGINIDDSHDVVIRNCIVRNVRTGIRIEGDSDRILVEDNELLDTTIKDWPWDKNKRHDTEGSGVSMKGRSAQVVRRNYVNGPFNALAASTWGDLENENKNYNSDIYDNFIEDVTDDGLEPEGTHINFRMWNNTFKNVFHPISLAPITRGPIYVFRNKIYNAGKSPLKFSNDYTGRVYVYHNSAYILDTARNGLNPSGRFGNTIMRNNIIYGHRYSFENTYGLTSPVDWDYDCLYTTELAPDFSHWIKWNNQRYSTIEDFRTATGQEMHGTSDDPRYVNIDAYNINLQSDSPCIDTGDFIPNINDWNYLGAAPDMGAIEFDSGAVTGCVDNDNDGFGSNPNNDCTDTRQDCDDLLASINPDAAEVCDDTNDNDCDSLIDCADSDCSCANCGPADTDDSGDVSTSELLTYINNWKQGSIGITELMTAITEWKTGC